MKKIFAAILGLSIILVSCSSPQQTATPAPLPDPLTTQWDDRALFRNGLVESQHAVLDELDGASVYHIEFNIAPEIYNITGHQDVRYTNTESVPLTEVQFRLFPNILGGRMDTSNISVDGQDVTPQLQLENSLLIVPLPQPLEPGQSAVIEMDFAVMVPQEVARNYGVLAYYEDVLALAHAYPMIAVYDDEGWNAEIPPQDGDVTYGDAAFFIVKVSAPQALTLVTSGSEISRSEDGQTQTRTVASGPARDFYLAASPLYEEISETFGEITVRSYAPAGFEDGAKMALEVAARAIEVFSARYAPYPYTEFDVVSTPTLALGIEYPGITAIASRIYDLDADLRGTPTAIYLESTVAHEVGHQWFYNLVGGDQLDDPWLDESLTQFATLQYYRDQYGSNAADGFRGSLESRWGNVGYAKIPIGLPVAGYEGGAYGAIVYGRGPLFFEALQQEMGVNVFEAFLREYTETLSWGIATPEFLQSLAEEHCSCDLDQIFSEWVYP
jgi:hypothetical protein